MNAQQVVYSFSAQLRWWHKAAFVGGLSVGVGYCLSVLGLAVFHPIAKPALMLGGVILMLMGLFWTTYARLRVERLQGKYLGVLSTDELNTLLAAPSSFAGPGEFWRDMVRDEVERRTGKA